MTYDTFRVVYLRVRKQVSSKGLKLKIRGYEKGNDIQVITCDHVIHCVAEFEYEYMTTEHTGGKQTVRMQHGKRSSRRDVLCVEYRLIEYPG